MFYLFIYVFCTTAAISTVKGEETVEEQMVQSAPTATLDFHVGDHDELKAASVYESLEDYRVRLYSCERKSILSAAVKIDKLLSCVQLRLIPKLNSCIAYITTVTHCKYYVLHKKKKNVVLV